MIISNNRINLDLSEVAILEMLKKDKEYLKELTTKKTCEDDKNEYILQKVAKIGQSSVVKEMLKLEGI